MLKKSFLIFFAMYSIVLFATSKNSLPNGYWLQKDKDANANISVIHAYNNQNGNLNAEIFVPLANVDDSDKAGLCWMLGNLQNKKIKPIIVHY